mmetsp:Transcript_42641/g.48319  ORF Transcript_42641/g.48319 Transcript_42641/m.48319 type:complete len:391 (-) Transcript_42641:133-1305(-)
MHGQEKGRDERERKKNRIKADEGVNSERDRGERRQRRYNKTMVLTIIKKRRMSTTTVSASMAVFLSLVMGVLLVAMMGTTIPTTFYFQQVDAFNNAASFIINHNNNHHSHHHQISSRSRDTTSTSTSTSSSLYFQKAPAVAEAIKQSKEKEEANDDSLINNVMTVEDEEILFGQDDFSERHPPFPQRHRSVSKSGNLLEDPYANSKQSKAELALEYSSTDPLINKLRTIRESTLQSCPEVWTHLSEVMPSDAIAIIDDHLCDDLKIKLTFQEMNAKINQAALVFRRFGVGRQQNKGSHSNNNVAILAENSARWLQVDHGIQRAGGVSAVRGADAPLDELRYIYEHSDSCGIVVLQGPKLLQKLLLQSKKRNNDVDVDDNEEEDINELDVG